MKQNFSQFEKGLKDGNHIQDQSLDTLLLIPVKPVENFGRDPRPPFNRNQAFQSIKPRTQRHREGLRGIDVEWQFIAKLFNYKTASSLATEKGLSTGKVPQSLMTTSSTGLSLASVFVVSIFLTTL